MLFPGPGLMAGCRHVKLSARGKAEGYGGDDARVRVRSQYLQDKTRCTYSTCYLIPSQSKSSSLCTGDGIHSPALGRADITCSAITSRTAGVADGGSAPRSTVQAVQVDPAFNESARLDCHACTAACRLPADPVRDTPRVRAPRLDMERRGPREGWYSPVGCLEHDSALPLLAVLPALRRLWLVELWHPARLLRERAGGTACWRAAVGMRNSKMECE